jgi:predicted nuclease of restriction endonuclease-like (RecB) superfamily
MYLAYPILQTVSAKLTWSHYVELLKIDDPLERSFYEKECEEEHWGVRELKRQMKSMLFHRLALSTDKQEVLKLASEGQIIEKPEDILKEPYVFEFTGLPQLPVYEEGDLEEALVNNLSMFFLELGKGFTYVGRQQKMVISGRTWKRIRDKYAAEHPFCELCFERGIIVPTEEIHHKLPLSEGGTHDRSNLIALCKSCHSTIHAKRGDYWGNHRG